jgi:hypothetical protein
MVTCVPLELSRGPFTVELARQLGVSRKVLSGQRFRQVLRGVHVLSSFEDSVTLLADAAALVLPAGFAFSHWTAAELCRFPLPAQAPNGQDLRAHVRGPADVERPRIDKVRAHRRPLARDDVVDFEGRLVTHPFETWLDLCAELAFDDLVVLGDAVLHRMRADPAALDARIGSGHRRRGVPLARRVLPWLEPRTESPGESWTRLTLIRGGLPRPEANLELYDAHGNWVARPDFVYRDPPVLIQYDGGDHFLDVRRRRHDAARDELSRELNYEVVVVTALDRRQPQRMVDRVFAARDRAAGRTPLGSLVDNWLREVPPWFIAEA